MAMIFSVSIILCTGTRKLGTGPSQLSGYLRELASSAVEDIVFNP